MKFGKAQTNFKIVQAERFFSLVLPKYGKANGIQKMHRGCIWKAGVLPIKTSSAVFFIGDQALEKFPCPILFSIIFMTLFSMSKLLPSDSTRKIVALTRSFQTRIARPLSFFLWSTVIYIYHETKLPCCKKNSSKRVLINLGSSTFYEQII